MAPLQTMKRVYAEILKGEEPWISLGNFMHQFFGSRKHLRAELVSDAIRVPKRCSFEQHKWAVFCAASVEYLCKEYAIPCPNWVHGSVYILADPWYYDLCADLPEVQEELRQTTPEEFTRRNIFCGSRTFDNKYEKKGRPRTAA